MSDNKERENVCRTLIRLWQDHFFQEPRNFIQTYEEIIKPSPTSSDISYDKELVFKVLRELVKEGILATQGAVLNYHFIEVWKPQGYSKW